MHPTLKLPVHIWVRITAALCAFVVCLRKIGDFDYWTHLALGRAYWQAGSVSIPEPFILSLLGQPVRETEWLFQLILYPLHVLGSHEAISIFVALLAAAALYVLAMALPSGIGTGTGMAAGAYLVATAVAVQIRFVPRPEALACLLLALALMVARAWCRAPGRSRLLALAGIFAIWVPLHITWTIGAVLVLATVLSRPHLGFWRDQLATGAGRLFVAMVSLAALLGSYRAAQFGLQVLGHLRPGSALAGITEMRPLWEFQSLLLRCGAVAVLGLICSWGERDGRIGRLIVWTLAAAAGLYVVRNVAMALLAMVPGALAGLSSHDRWLSGRRQGVVAALSLVVVIVLMTGSLRNREAAWGAGVDWPLFPRDAARFVRQHPAAGTILNNWDCGGYLDWDWNGRPPTFLDGRLGAPDVVAAHDAIVDGTDPAAAVARFGISTILMQPLYFNSGRIVPGLFWLLQNPDWLPVHASDAVVFMRRPLPAGVSPLTPADVWRSLQHHIELLAPGMPDRPHLSYSRAVAAFFGGNGSIARLALGEGMRQHPELLEAYRPFFPFTGN